MERTARSSLGLDSAFPDALRRTLAVCAVLGLAACSGDRQAESAAQRSGVPGHVSAGGATSGEVIAQAEGQGTGGSAGPEGTPGIPQGAGGTTGGPNMGGSTGAQAASERPARLPSSDGRPGTGATHDEKQDRPAGSGSAGTAAGSPDNGKDAAAKDTAAKEAAAKEAAAKEAADRQQKQLVAAMERASDHWRARQASPNGGTAADATDDSRAAPAQQPPSSEKHGNAPASEDVKQPQQQSPDASGASLPSDAYKHGR
jgi:hypothetical protein